MVKFVPTVAFLGFAFCVFYLFNTIRPYRRDFEEAPDNIFAPHENELIAPTSTSLRPSPMTNTTQESSDVDHEPTAVGPTSGEV